jgi:UDP-3-O-[3-hydroxymyristoyl] glucosamine N-acyltransferase
MTAHRGAPPVREEQEQNMTLPLADIATLVNGSLTKDGHIQITGAGSLEHAREGEITYIDRAELLAEADSSGASAFIAPKDAPRGKKPMILTEDPRLAFSKVLEVFAPKPKIYPGIHPTAVVDESAQLGESVSIGAQAYVGENARIGDRVVVHPMAYVGCDVTVGDDCVIFPQVYLGDRCVLGNRVVLQPGASVGGDGFGYAQENGRQKKIPQVGIVIVEDDVEIGANCTVDRATLGATKIGRGTKIDDHVHVAHNVVIGEDCLICGQVGISGSAKIGNRVIMAGQVGVNDHIAIGDDIVIGGQAGVFSDLPKPGYYSGYPARPHNSALRVLAATQKLPELAKRLKRIEVVLRERGISEAEE